MMLNYEEIQDRAFPGWQMAFALVDRQAFGSIDGFSNYIDDPQADLSENLKAGFAREAVERFKHDLCATVP